MSWVIEKSEHKLGTLVVLLMIANHAKSDGTGAWPSIPTLAREARLSERQVQYALRRLERSGELQTQVRLGPYGTNMYSLPKMVVQKLHQGVVQSSSPGVQSTAPGGAMGFTRVVQSSSPNPSFNRPEDKERVPPKAGGRKFNKADYSASDVEAYDKLYREHPELKPPGW